MQTWLAISPCFQSWCFTNQLLAEVVLIFPSYSRQKNQLYFFIWPIPLYKKLGIFFKKTIFKHKNIFLWVRHLKNLTCAEFYLCTCSFPLNSCCNLKSGDSKNKPCLSSWQIYSTIILMTTFVYSVFHLLSVSVITLWFLKQVLAL